MHILAWLGCASLRSQHIPNSTPLRSNSNIIVASLLSPPLRTVLTLISLSLSLLLTFYFRVPCTFCIISILSSLISSYYGLTWLNTSTTTSKTLPMSMLTFIMSGLLVFASEKPSVTNALTGLGEESITAGKVVDKETRYTPPKMTEVTSKER